MKEPNINPENRVNPKQIQTELNHIVFISVDLCVLSMCIEKKKIRSRLHCSYPCRSARGKRIYVAGYVMVAECWVLWTLGTTMVTGWLFWMVICGQIGPNEIQLQGSLDLAENFVWYSIYLWSFKVSFRSQTQKIEGNPNN